MLSTYFYKQSYPGSKVMPQFNKETLGAKLAKYKIKYFHLPKLGGRCKVKTDIHSSIQSPGFAGYADHIMTNDFRQGLKLLKRIGRKCRTAYMCAEGPYFKCHRRMINDRLEYDGWEVYHLNTANGVPKRHDIWDISRLDKDNNIIYDR